MLVGREAECGLLDHMLEQADRGRPEVLVVRGEPGIGKSALLQHAARRAREQQVTVLEARGVESEAELAFSGLAQLLDPVLDGLGQIPTRQADALAGALAIGFPVAADLFATHAATLSLFAEAAEERTLLAVADDAHRLDVASLRALLFVARRLTSERVVLLFAVRDQGASALDDAGLPEHSLAGLDLQSSHLLLSTCVDREIDAQVAGRLVDAARGNPLALVEMARALSPDQLAGREALDDPLPPGPGLERVFGGLVAVLPDETRRALVTVAAGNGEPTAAVLAAMEGLGITGGALDRAEAAGLVSVDSAEIVWRHPLLRSVVYRAASAADRRAAHRALADALSVDHPGDARAWHLAAAAVRPDEDVASALEHAARRARERGGHAAAAEALERAATLTPKSEPRARRLLQAAGDAQVGGRARHAVTLLDEALDLAGDDALLRADIQVRRAQSALWAREPKRVYDLLSSEATRIEAPDPGRAVLMLSYAALICIRTGDVIGLRAAAARARELSERVGDTAVAAADVLMCNAGVLSGDADGALPYLTRLRELLSLDPGPLSPHLVHAGAHVLIWIEEYALARQALEGAIESARATSAGGLLSFPLSLLSELNFRTGRWHSAYAEATEAIRLAEDVEQENQLSFALAVLAGMEAGQGGEAECRAHVARAADLAGRTGSESILTQCGSVLGLLELGLGRPDRAVDHLSTVAEWVDDHDLREPGTLWWAPDLIEAYVLTGDAPRAADALATFEAQAERTGRLWALATAARCRGMLASADSFEGEFGKALRWHDETPAPFERARTELRFGERLRREKKLTEARSRLRAALEIFERLGARPWVDRAEGELRATGERRERSTPNALYALTPQELQIALRVGGGATNREIAAALFVSAKTVEYHLTKVYAKLGVPSRTALAALVAEALRQPAHPGS